MAAEQTLARIDENGQLTIPPDVRQHLGLEEGGVVVVTEIPDGILITPREVAVTRALDQIGEILREEGRSLDELIESGRALRGDLMGEQYGIKPSDETS